MVIGTIRLRLVAGQHQNGDARLWSVEPWFRYHTFMSRPRKRRRQPDQSSAGPSPTVSTYQTRIAVYAGRDRADGDAGLSAYAELYGKVQRKLFSDVAAGRSAASLNPNPPKGLALTLTQGLMGRGRRTGQARFQ